MKNSNRSQFQFVELITIGNSICETDLSAAQGENITDNCGGYAWQSTASSLNPLFNAMQNLGNSDTGSLNN
jgi:hypothetical protein